MHEMDDTLEAMINEDATRTGCTRDGHYPRPIITPDQVAKLGDEIWKFVAQLSWLESDPGAAKR
jgi:hypothetical protein